MISIVAPYILSDDEIARLSQALACMRESEVDRMDFVLLSSLLHTGLRAMELLTIKTAELRRNAAGGPSGYGVSWRTGQDPAETLPS